MVNVISNERYRLKIDNAFLYTLRGLESAGGKKWLKLGPLPKCTSYASACTKDSRVLRDMVFTVVIDGNKLLLKQGNLYATALTENGTFFHMADRKSAAARFSKSDLSALHYGGKVAKGVNNMAEVSTDPDIQGTLHVIPYRDIPEGTYTVKIAAGGVFHGHNGTKKWPSYRRNYSGRDCNSDGHRNEYLSGELARCEGTAADLWDPDPYLDRGWKGPHIVVKKPELDVDGSFSQDVYQLQLKGRCIEKSFLSAAPASWDCDHNDYVGWGGTNTYDGPPQTFWNVKAHPDWDGKEDSAFHGWYSIRSAFDNCPDEGKFVVADEDCDEKDLRVRPGEDWWLFTPVESDADDTDDPELSETTSLPDDMYILLDQNRMNTNTAFKFKLPMALTFYSKTSGNWQIQEDALTQGAKFREYKDINYLHEFVLIYSDQSTRRFKFERSMEPSVAKYKELMLKNM